jgi:hypothetical protein
MSLLIYSGLLYLIGISTILILKPEVMFTKDGDWKEFGLGRNKDKYTWMPFWLFAILWAILSYLLILLIASSTGIGGVTNNADLSVRNEVIEPEHISTKGMANSIKQKPHSVEEMKRGYYLLDVNETAKKGMPKYIYLGPEPPNMTYHDISSDSANGRDA